MSLARRYNRLLRRHTLHFAAWSPIHDPQRVGDYGLLDRGIFRKLGNIADFGVQFGTEVGNAAAFDFTSDVSTVVRFEAGVEVPVFSAGSVGASLKIEFEGKFAALVKSPKVELVAMTSIHQVAAQLQHKAGWKPRFRIISKVYSGSDAIVIASLDNATSIELSGSVDALRKLELGQATVGVSVGGVHQLKLVGASGPLAIDLFRVRRAGAVSLKLHAMDFDAQEPDDLIDGSENWDTDTDDLGEP